MRTHPAGLDTFSGGRPLRVPPEVRAPSMVIGNELGQMGGVRRGVLEPILVDGRQQLDSQHILFSLGSLGYSAAHHVHDGPRTYLRLYEHERRPTSPRTPRTPRTASLNRTVFAPLSTVRVCGLRRSPAIPSLTLSRSRLSRLDHQSSSSTRGSGDLLYNQVYCRQVVSLTVVERSAPPPPPTLSLTSPRRR